MNQRFFITVLLVTFFIQSGAQVNFAEVTSAEEMAGIYERASQENMNIFVDVYATWCGPCKWMDANVFELQEAGDYMNREFINVKIDGDSEYGYSFARENGLQAYPSFFLFNSEQKLMNKIVGAKPWEEFGLALKSTIENFPVLEVLRSKYESNMLERDEYARFVGVLDEMGKEEYAVAVTEQYLSSFFTNGLTGDTEFSDYDIRVLALHAAPSGMTWKILTENPARLQAILGNDDFKTFVDDYYNQALMQAVEQEDLGLVENLNRQLERLTDGSEIDLTELQTRAYVLYYSYTGGYNELIRFIDSSYEEQFSNDHEWLFKAAVDAVFVDPGNQVMVEKGLEWFAECIRLEPRMDYYYHLGYCQYLVNDHTSALDSFRKALELTDDKDEKEEISGIIEQLVAEMESM